MTGYLFFTPHSRLVKSQNKSTSPMLARDHGSMELCTGFEDKKKVQTKAACFRAVTLARTVQRE